MEEANANRNHKNSVFTSLFSEKNNLLELYNAITGKNYPENTDIKVITLPDVLFMEKVNDICFVIGNRLVVLIEHQSTINENMCLRMGMYAFREYELLTESDDLFKAKRVKIPKPEFIVLYNGKKEFPDFKKMRLSESFEFDDGTFTLDLEVKIYNINKGRNVEIAKRSPVLAGYETFIAEIKKHEQELGLAGAIKKAVKTCMGKKILLNFLKRNASEVENMLFGEWNWDKALAVRYEEGKEEGVAIGEKRGERRGIKKLLALLESGMSLAEAKRKLALPKTSSIMHRR